MPPGTGAVPESGSTVTSIMPRALFRVCGENSPPKASRPSGVVRVPLSATLNDPIGSPPIQRR